jgi:hypothetical protein
MKYQTQQAKSSIDPRFDRPCEHLAMKKSADAPWGLNDKRGALDLGKDGSQHRRFHSFYEDLLN